MKYRIIPAARVLFFAILGVLVIGTLPATPAGAEPEIGAVFQRAFMGATGTRIGATTAEPLYFNTPVYAEETVKTDRGGSTAIRFADGTKLQVGSSSSVVLDRFVYDPDSGRADAAIRFAKGIFRFVSGDAPKDGIRLETPTATLAIRGTRFILGVSDAGDTELWVIEGAVEAIPREGAPATARAGQSLIVVAGTPGVRVVDGRAAPRDAAVEDDLPNFFQPRYGDERSHSGERTSGGSRRSGGGGRTGGSGGNQNGGN